MADAIAFVYLIHFDRPYKHARHYIGYTALESVEARVERHRAGRGARLLAVATAEGIAWKVVRTWEFDTIRGAKVKEKALKHRAATRICPACKADH